MTIQVTLALVPFLLCHWLFAQAPPALAATRLPVREVTVFKDGHAYLIREAALPEGPRPALASGPLTPDSAAETLAALLPTHAILVDEGITLRDPFFNAVANAPPHDWLGNIGGAIGGALPLSTGAAIAEPKRRVITITGDGSAMYAVQALWTQAREQLDVTTIILSNRKYAVLYRELEGVGAKPGPTVNDLFALDRPPLDWVSMSKSMGVDAARADTLERLTDLLRRSFSTPGPFLIELPLE